MSGAHRKMGLSAWPPTRERLDPTRSPRLPYDGRHRLAPGLAGTPTWPLDTADCTPAWAEPEDESFGRIHWSVNGSTLSEPLDEEILSDRVTLVLRVSRAAVSERLDPTWSPQKAEALAEIEAALHLACRQALGLGGNGGDVLC